MPANNPHPPILPMNAAALMDRVFDLYKRAFWLHILFAIIMGALSIALVFVSAIVLSVALAMTAFVAYAADGAFNVALVVILVVLVPLYVCWSYIAQSGHILLSKYSFYGERPSLPFVATFAAFFRVLTVALAQVIMFIPFFLLVASFLYLIFGAWYDTLLFNWILWEAPWIFWIIIIAVMLGFLLFSNVFALSIPAALLEKKHFFAAILRSYRLMKGSFWRIFGIRVLWFIAVFLFAFAAQNMIWVAFELFFGIGGEVTEAMDIALLMGGVMFQFIISLIVSLLTAPLEGIMTGLIYFNQRIKKEGLAIEIGLIRLTRKFEWEQRVKQMQQMQLQREAVEATEAGSL